jgi:hypothetical protein
MNDRIFHTKNLREELAKVTFAPYPANPWINIESWIAKATPFIRKYWNNNFPDFQEVTAEPQWPKIAGAVGEELNKARWQTKKNTAENALQKILSFMDGLLELETLTMIDSDDALDRVLFLCKRFPIFARQLSKRGRERSPVEINDEYDLQYLFHALLKLHFDDVRAEEWTPSDAGRASRVDYLLKEERIVIEVKKTRDGLADKELGEQFIIDIARYQSHPDCSTLVCYAYDPEYRINNPKGLVSDLSNKSSEDFDVIVLIEPSYVLRKMSANPP